MKTQLFLLISLLSLNIFGSVAHNDTEPLIIPPYNMTREIYLQLTNDTVFNNDFLDYQLNVYNLSYLITKRSRQLVTGNLTLTLDANQTENDFFNPYPIWNQGVQASVWIEANKAMDIQLPDSLEVSVPTLQKVLRAYVEFILPREVSHEIALPDTVLNPDLLSTFMPFSTFRFTKVPDMSLSFQNFTSELSSDRRGSIIFSMHGSSTFLSYTPRFRGSPWIITNVPVKIVFIDDPRIPVYQIDYNQTRPFDENEVLELVRGFYNYYALPLIMDLYT